MIRLRAALGGAILLLLAACQTSQVAMNAPLPRDAAGSPIYRPGYSLLGLMTKPRGGIFLAVAFSGGGKRSAAFAYGALKGLRDLTIIDDGARKPLLDEVDYISAVSGGSFPAAYYGLYRDRVFTDFETDFLKRDINAFVWGVYLLPWNWEWIINPFFGTNDAMAAVYDRLMFHGATYADLKARGLPMISIDATDLAGGLAFPFNQSSFDLLCSNLDTFPVSRAVAASAGFPILFSPITLTSHREACLNYPPPGAPPPGWADQAHRLSRATVLAANAERTMDPERTQFVHLMDGGIADNLALRSMSNALVQVDDDTELRRIAASTRRVIVISVDGQATRDQTLGQRRVINGLGRIISAVSSTQIDAYSFETLLLVDQQVKELTEKLKTLRCQQAKVIDGHDCNDVEGGLVQLSLSEIQDRATRERLQAIPTSLTIPDADVDALVAAGQAQMVNNAQLRALLADFRPEATPRIAMRTRPGR
ncbi:MAG: patatin-like phospholipase family protein [Proteobacteria bacterium]|nr:patatin-like phospholipase family protein [Pseudomonadota bacterium]